LEKFKDRLWIPHQVALEYQENKESRIKKVNQSYENINKGLEETKKSIPQDEGIKNILENSAKEVEKYKQSFLESSRIKNISQKIDSLFSQKNIGEKPENQLELDAIYQDGEERYKKNMPPGFKNNKKTDSYLHLGLKFECKYGDLILWKQVLKQVQNKSLSYIVFITSENQEDWWRKEQGEILGPRRELIREILDAGASMFHMYKPDQFLKYALEYFDIEIQEESIQQVEEVSAVTNASEEAQLVKQAYENMLLNISSPSEKLDLIKLSELMSKNSEIIRQSIEPIASTQRFKEVLAVTNASELLQAAKRANDNISNMSSIVAREFDSVKISEVIRKSIEPVASMNLASLNRLAFEKFISNMELKNVNFNTEQIKKILQSQNLSQQNDKNPEEKNETLEEDS
jgi:hypothetical protein